MSKEQFKEHQNSNIEKSYRKLSDVEHVLIRPTVYIGSVNEESFNEVHAVNDDGLKIINGELKYTKGSITLFNELVNNSYDEYIRTKQLAPKQRLTEIGIRIDAPNGMLEISDNGGIPVVIHKDENIMLPHLLFGFLRSGSNYDDARGDVSGTNGLGASLVNVFSKRYEVITCDGKKHYHGVWLNNMGEYHSEKVTSATGKTKGTKTIAYLDFQHLGIPHFTDDLISKFMTRAVEIAAMGYNKTQPLKVNFHVTYMDGRSEKFFISYNSFEDYTKLYDGVDSEGFQGLSFDNMDFVVGCSDTDSMESVAILNSIRCDFGTHIDFLADPIVNHIRTFMNKKHKIDLKPKQIKDRLKFISRWSIPNPAFKTQTKDELTTPAKDFNFVIELPKKFTAWLEKSEIVNRLLDFHNSKKLEDENAALRRAQSGKVKTTHIPKLVDASSKDRSKTMIFLAEGDSAMNGVRRCRKAEFQGGFCLGGKFVNSLDMKPAEIVKLKGKTTDKNKNNDSKAKHLMDALGLRFGEKAVDTLRYGQVCIMTDADYDGYAIACQVVLLFRKFWPDMIEEGRLFRVLSPIMVARKGKDTKVYYTMDAYKKEEKTLLKNKYQTKHIKGLAALQPEEYSDVIKNPVLQKITTDLEDWETLTAWFSDDADVRKELMNK